MEVFWSDCARRILTEWFALNDKRLSIVLWAQCEDDELEGKFGRTTVEVHRRSASQ